MTGAIELASPPRLNPFAFPSETTQRTILLCVFALCGCGALYGEFPDASDRGAMECLSQLWMELADIRSHTVAAMIPAEMARTNTFETVARCSELMQPGALRRIGVIVLAAMVAVCVYRIYPQWILRSGRLKPVETFAPSEVVRELEGLANLAGLQRRVAFVWNPLTTDQPVAFGHRGSRHIALSGAFVMRYFTERGAFRAIVLHELAHVRSGDVGKAYAALSLVLAFALVGLLPSLLVCCLQAISGHVWEAGLLLLHASFWSAAVILTGLSVLRVREHYADVQASVWEGPAAIDRALAALPAPQRQDWRRHLRLHPDPRDRRAVVQDPARLFGVGLGDAFGVGIAAWSVIGVATGILVPFLPLDTSAGLLLMSAARVVVAAIVFAVAVGAVGIGVWREAFASLVRGEEPSGTGWAGLAFVAGAMPGTVYLLLRTFLLPASEQPVAMASIQVGAAINLVVLLCSVLVFGLIGAAVSAWFRPVLRSRSVAPFLVIGVIVPVLLVLTALSAASFLGYLSLFASAWQGRWMPMLYGYVAAVGIPLILVFVLAWALPLSSAWLRSANGAVEYAEWVFLDGARQPVLAQDPLRPGRALGLGVAGGLFLWLLLILLYYRARLPLGLDEAVAATWRAMLQSVERLTGEDGAVMAVAAVPCLLVVAAVAAFSARRLGIAHGLCAASGAGAVIFAGDLLFFGIAYEFPWSILQGSLVKLSFGMAVALPAAVIGASAGSIARRALAGRTSPTSSGWLSGLKKGLMALLCFGVGVGMVARIGEEVGAVREVRAAHLAAEAGDGDAQERLGEIYAEGWFVRQDDAQAVDWWSKAAAQGRATAQYRLAKSYFEGRGIAADEVVAFEWIRRAAGQGHEEAASVLGWMYAEGRGTLRDEAMARRWFEQAASRGNRDAQNRLGVLYATGAGGERDDIAAVAWLRKAADQGLADAQFNLAFMYLEGRGLESDEAEALRWLVRAATSGHLEAQYLAGEMYRFGQGTARSDAEAVGWLRRAASQRHSGAAESLLSMCESGIAAACGS